MDGYLKKVNKQSRDLLDMELKTELMENSQSGFSQKNRCDECLA